MDVVLADPAVAGFGSSVGASGFNASVNHGRLFISLKPLAERGNVSTQRVVARLRAKLNHIPGLRVFMVPAQDLRYGGRQSDSQYQFTLWSADIDALQQWVPKVVDRVKELPGVTDVTTDREQGGLQANVDHRPQGRRAPRRAHAGHRQRAQRRLLAAADFHHLRTRATSIAVILEVDPQGPARPHRPRRRSTFRATATAQVPLSAVARFERAIAPLVVNHQGQFPSVTITYNLERRARTIAAARPRRSRRRWRRCMCPIRSAPTSPATCWPSSRALGAQPLLILAALIAVYIVLGVLYESLAHPLTIISTLPSAGLGALLALQLSSTELTVIAFIGIILLIGIVKKNGIMMVDFALDGERRRGLPPRAARSTKPASSASGRS